MVKYFVSEDRIFMEVHPVQNLMHSNLIRETVTNGGKFLVDMNTGELTIRHPLTLDGRIKYPKKYVWWRGKDKGSKQLSNEVDTAIAQLSDEFTLGYGAGRLYVNGQCKFSNDLDTNKWKYWKDIIREIKNIYKYS